jgi:type I restriction enzyme S subunit
MGEWNECNLGKLIDYKKGFAFKSQDLDFNNSVPVVKLTNTKGHKIDIESCDKVNKELAKQLSDFKLQVNDIIIATVGSWPSNPASVVGKIIKADNTAEGSLLNQNAVRIRKKGDASQLFIYYLLCNNSFQDYIISTAQGSANQASITLKDIFDYTFLLPSLAEQERIAEVFSSLDEKIDLLHNQNKTLEEMAETLFRQWFVVEAKDDWENGLFSDLVTVKYGKDHQKLVEGVIPAYGSGGIMRMVNKALYEKESVLIPRKGTLSNIIYINKPFWTVDTMFFTEMKRNNIAKFIYHFIKEQDLGSMNVGSAVPSMTTDILNNLPITIPTETVLERFEAETTSFYKKIDSNNNQIQQLETLRDTLLPKLMSGLVLVKQ